MPADNSKLSAVLEEALNDIDGTVTVGEVIDRVADRGFGVVLILIALPTMIPILPPGASAVVGILFLNPGRTTSVWRRTSMDA